MTRVDLDYVQARVDKAGDVRHGFVLLPIEDAQDMAAELRAAREVVDAARWIERTGALPPSNEVGARRLSDLEQAVRAYDEAAVGS